MLVQEGENEIEIALTNSLRNLIGPHHRPQGELDHAWGENAFSGRYASRLRKTYPRWYEQREQETDAWTDDSFVVRFGLAGHVEIRYLLESGE